MELANGSQPKPKAQPKPAPPSVEPSAEKPPQAKREGGPQEFLFEIADDGANYYRAYDATAELVAGLYSDGRIRLADSGGRRFAGALIGGHADLLELQRNEWSEVFLRVTPTGRMQLELRGGPYDAHVLTCEPLVQ